jgi:hypothetical protein
LVAVLTSLQAAAGTAAPLVSTTVPLSVLETVCAMAEVARMKAPKAKPTWLACFTDTSRSK